MSLNVDPSITVKGNITLLEKVGEGSYGEVWKAKWNNTTVAIKKLELRSMTPESLRKLEAEIKISTTIRHPNVVSVFGVHVARTTEIWVVMELADGGSLYSQLSNPNIDIPWSKRWKWAMDVTAAVSFLHQSDIIHRDIKSPNFLLVKGDLKISDFGTSIFASIASSIRPATLPNSSPGIGTIRWLAPECFAKKPIIDKRSDVYSMGIVLWEIASRQLPFQDQPNDYIIPGLVLQHERPDIPQECPEEFKTIFTKCWDHEIDARPSAEEANNFLVSAALNLETSISSTQPLYTSLRVTIVEASNLKAVYISSAYLQNTKPPSPYATLCVRHVTWNSPILKETLNPTWRFTFPEKISIAPLNPEETPLVVSLRHRDGAFDTYLGEATFVLAPADVKHNNRIELTQNLKANYGEIAGSITVSILVECSVARYDSSKCYSKSQFGTVDNLHGLLHAFALFWNIT